MDINMDFYTFAAIIGVLTAIYYTVKVIVDGSVERAKYRSIGAEQKKENYPTSDERHLS